MADTEKETLSVLNNTNDGQSDSQLAVLFCKELIAKVDANKQAQDTKNLEIDGIDSQQNQDIDSIKAEQETQNNKISTVEQNFNQYKETVETTKQNTLVAGKNININKDSNEISAEFTQEPYLPGLGILVDETSKTISINEEIVSKKADLDAEIQNRTTEDAKLQTSIDNLLKVHVYAETTVVKQNELVLRAGKVYIAKEDIILSTWETDEPKLTLTDSDTISCVMYDVGLKIEIGKLVIYNSELYLCENTIDATTNWETDKNNFIPQKTIVDLSGYYTKDEADNLLNNKTDKTVFEKEVSDSNAKILEIENKITAEVSERSNKDTELQGLINAKVGQTEINAAKQELNNSINTKASNDTIGALPSLNTDVKTSIVDAINSLHSDVSKISVNEAAIFNKIYPVGSIYITINATFNPANTFGGTWAKIEEGRYLRAVTNNNAGQKVEAGLPSHTHSASYVSSKIDWGVTGLNLQTYRQGATSAYREYDYGRTLTTGNPSDSIYGKSNTVTPASINVIMWQRTA